MDHRAPEARDIGYWVICYLEQGKNRLVIFQLIWPTTRHAQVLPCFMP